MHISATRLERCWTVYDEDTVSRRPCVAAISVSQFANGALFLSLTACIQPPQSTVHRLHRPQNNHCVQGVPVRGPSIDVEPK